MTDDIREEPPIITTKDGRLVTFECFVCRTSVTIYASELAARGSRPRCSTRCQYTKTPIETWNRFWGYVEKTPKCWLWNTGDYGRFWHDGITEQATHYIYKIVYGPIPDGQEICHHCDNPPCVRPDHLFAGTQSDNHRDAQTKGIRPIQGTHCPHGHEYSPANTYVRNGVTGKQCRECQRQHSRRRRQQLDAR